MVCTPSPAMILKYQITEFLTCPFNMYVFFHYMSEYDDNHILDLLNLSMYLNVHLLSYCKKNIRISVLGVHS